MGYLGLEEAERAIKLGAYTQAYEIFVAMVESGEDPAFYKLCEMAIHAQLHEDQQKDFADRLERAVRQDNESATYNMAVLYSRGVVFERDLQKQPTSSQRPAHAEFRRPLQPWPNSISTIVMTCR